MKSPKKKIPQGTAGPQIHRCWFSTQEKNIFRLFWVAHREIDTTQSKANRTPYLSCSLHLISRPTARARHFCEDYDESSWPVGLTFHRRVGVCCGRPPCLVWKLNESKKISGTPKQSVKRSYHQQPAAAPCPEKTRPSSARAAWLEMRRWGSPQL